ncbi:MAG: hypothetical protein F7B60_04710 [Desulfurococcales archaeon]|nr:hypothetical protein [Desulfurococcales archaeon]
MGYNKAKAKVIDKGNTVRVSVPGGMDAVIPKSSLCKFFKRYNLEADSIKC